MYLVVRSQFDRSASLLSQAQLGLPQPGQSGSTPCLQRPISRVYEAVRCGSGQNAAMRRPLDPRVCSSERQSRDCPGRLRRTSAVERSQHCGFERCVRAQTPCVPRWGATACGHEGARPQGSSERSAANLQAHTCSRTLRCTSRRIRELRSAFRPSTPPPRSSERAARCGPACACVCTPADTLQPVPTRRPSSLSYAEAAPHPRGPARCKVH